MAPLLLLLLCSGLNGFAGKNTAPAFLWRCNEQLIQTVVEDIFAPPVASRIFVYPNIAAYEVLCRKYSELKPLAGQIAHLKPIPSAAGNVDYSLAAETAFLVVGKKLVFSEYQLQDFFNRDSSQWIADGISPEIVEASVVYGKQVAGHIIRWIQDDQYIYTRTLERYVQADSPGAWRPTAPEYMNALEPNWPLMRSLVADRSDYMRAVPNIPYSENRKSLYYRNAQAVYQSDRKKDSNRIRTALYWDDNPNTAVVNGHVTYFIHKIGPPGHWLHIAMQSARARNLDEAHCTELFTMVTVALYEGFLSCWAEKYKSNAVRPETYIHRLIDPQWRPLIETPPFPEYTSGHSVVSGAASSMLTHYLPAPHAFTDSTQQYLSLPPRTFSSFKAAAAEASVSRFYGGIHFMPSLDNGLKQGDAVCQYILKTLHTR